MRSSRFHFHSSSLFSIVLWSFKLEIPSKSSSEIEVITERLDWRGLTPLEIGEARGMIQCCELLERFMADPLTTRHRLQLEVGDQGENHDPSFLPSNQLVSQTPGFLSSGAVAAGYFAFLVFLSDHYIHLKSDSRIRVKREIFAWRFLSIGSKLPLELQQVLSNRAAGLARNGILFKDSEPAFHVVATMISS